MNYVKYNKVNTIIGCGGVLWFSNHRIATFDSDANLYHRCSLDILGDNLGIRIDDLIGG